MFRHDEHISHPSERCIVRHDPRKSDLPVTVVDTKRQRVLNRALDNLPRPPRSPVRMIADEVVDEIDVQAGLVRADGVFTALPRLLF